MKLTLERHTFTENYTEGILTIPGKFSCDTIEDRDRGLAQSMPEAEIMKRKVYGETAIPAGEYRVTLKVQSPKFKDRAWAKFCDGRLPRLEDVPGYQGVLIHVGNSAADSLGCILVGKKAGAGRIGGSADTFRRLYDVLKEADGRGENITVRIVRGQSSPFV